MSELPEITSGDPRKLTQRILSLADKIYQSLEPDMPHEGLSRLLSSDLTVAQLRVLLLLQARRSIRMSGVAEHLGIALSTATGIVDKLVSKGLALREADTEDRRVVIITLSSEGEKIMGGLWDVGRSQVTRLLEGLTIEQLAQTANTIETLYANLKNSNPG
jgi:DNA-binding MarR family transcriptional regulator